MRRPTHQDIARVAGVSVASVSFALGSNVRHVSRATRERIEGIAKKLGYRPNPMQSAWQAEIRARRKNPVRAALAWINDHEEETWWNTEPYLGPFHAGARQRARELGYAMDPIWLSGRAESPPEDYAMACVKILRARGISGVILPYLGRMARAAVDWPGCAVVVVGKTERLRQVFLDERHHPDAEHPVVHHWINPDFFHNATVAFRRLTALGYQRIGLAISAYHDEESDDQITSAMRHETLSIPPSRRVPFLISQPGRVSVDLPPWIRKYRPDVVLAGQRESKRIIEGMGLRIPEDIGLAHLDVKEDVPDWSGIVRHSDIIGEAAVDLLAACLQHNETGIPAHPKEVLIKGSWVDGKTTRVQ